MTRFSLTPKHSFGQNFLSDAGTAQRIAELIGGKSQSEPLRILELGAGLGALTSHLLAAGHHVIAVERDRDLVPALHELFAEQIERGKLTVLEADAKTLDWAAQFDGSERQVLAGNLPYQITGPLLEKTCLLTSRLERAVFLVQKEVGDRLAAAPGSKTYGALSVFIQARFSVKRAFVVGAGSFYPAPRVASAVVVLTPHAEPITEETAVFRSVVQSAFHARRKTLRNAWKSLGSLEMLERVAAKTGVDLDARGETLDVRQFAEVARALEQARGQEPSS